MKIILIYIKDYLQSFYEDCAYCIVSLIQFCFVSTTKDKESYLEESKFFTLADIMSQFLNPCCSHKRYVHLDTLGIDWISIRIRMLEGYFKKVKQFE